jgi:hypothetical protein
MRKLTLICITAVSIFVPSLTGCRYLVSEPYPGYIVSKISPRHLPGTVRDGFTALYPKAMPERVDALSFKGQIGLYRILFQTTGGELTNAVFTRSGSLTTTPSSFPPPGYPVESKTER